VTRNCAGDVITVDLDCGDCRGGDRGAFELVDVGVVRPCGMLEHVLTLEGPEQPTDLGRGASAKGVEVAGLKLPLVGEVVPFTGNLCWHGFRLLPEHAVGLLRRLKDLGFHPCEFVFNVDPIDGWAAELWPTECLG